MVIPTDIDLDPVGRIEGHMGVGVTTDGTSLVTDVKIKSNMYRGFENILYKRPVKDVIHLVQRI